MTDPTNSKNIKDWVAKRAFEIAKEEVEAEGKHQWEQVPDVAQFRYSSDPNGYLILALIEYLEQR